MNPTVTSTTPFIDMTGQRIGKLVVIRYAGSANGSRKPEDAHRNLGAQWAARCDCGRVELWRGNFLRRAARKFPMLSCRECR